MATRVQNGKFVSKMALLPICKVKIIEHFNENCDRIMRQYWNIHRGQLKFNIKCKGHDEKQTIDYQNDMKTIMKNA